MNDFDDQFKAVSDRIKKQHARTKFWGPIAAVFSTVVWFGIVFFIGWVIVKVMAHCGVLG